MGWRQLCAFQRAMIEAKRGPEQDPNRWAGSEWDPWWQEARQKRERMRGR